MTVAPDPSEITPPTDPAVYARPRTFGVAFWAVIALCVLSVVAGAAVTRFAPRIWGKPAEAPAPAASIADLPDLNPQSPPRQAGATLDGVQTASSVEIAALQTRIEALEAGQTRTVNAAAAALAAASLAEATQGSGAFEAELSALERVLPLSAEVRSLRPYAENGVPSRAALAADFDAVAAKAAVAARDPGERAGFFASAAHALSAIVTIRRVGAGGEGPDAVLARAGDAVALGDLEGALKILRELPPKAAEALVPWRSRALQRIAVDRQVASIRALALSDLMAVSRAQP
ncbi:MAG: COG4223 family protein [Caulobacter sp.]